MENYFKFEEFCITGDTLPIDIATKILVYHISPMNTVRAKLGFSIWPSQKSGYRPKSWELSKGRSGNSQHTFKEKGAVDWTCKNFLTNKHRFIQFILLYTEYTRIAVYDSFVHCDYKNTKSGKREVYTSTPDSKWKLAEKL